MLDRFNLWMLSVTGRIQELKREDGQAMVEYALILGLVSVVALIALTAIGTSVNSIFNSIGSALAGA